MVDRFVERHFICALRCWFVCPGSQDAGGREGLDDREAASDAPQVLPFPRVCRAVRLP